MIKKVFSISSFKLSQVSRSFVLVAMKEKTVSTSPSVTLPIEEVSFKVGAKNNLLKDLKPEQLWELTKDNGANFNGNQFYTATGLENGSAVVITPSDFDSSDATFQSNVQKTHDVEITATVRNNSSDEVTDVKLYLFSLLDYYMAYTPIAGAGGAYQVQELSAHILPDEIPTNPDDIMYEDLHWNNRNVIGGLPGWLGKVGKFFKKNKDAIRGARKAIEPFTRNIPGAQTVHAVADSLGYGNKRTQKKKPGRKPAKKGRGLLQLGGASYDIDDLEMMM